MSKPNCTKFISKDTATGAKIGANNMIAGLLSRNMPQKSSSTLIMSSSSILLCVIPINAVVIACGIYSLESSQLKSDVAAIIEEITAVFTAAL